MYRSADNAQLGLPWMEKRRAEGSAAQLANYAKLQNGTWKEQSVGNVECADVELRSEALMTAGWKTGEEPEEDGTFMYYHPSKCAKGWATRPEAERIEDGTPLWYSFTYQNQEGYILATKLHDESGMKREAFPDPNNSVVLEHVGGSEDLIAAGWAESPGNPATYWYANCTLNEWITLEEARSAWYKYSNGRYYQHDESGWCNERDQEPDCDIIVTLPQAQRRRRLNTLERVFEKILPKRKD